MNNYQRITYQEMLEDFTSRLRNDPRFKNMSSASIYYLFMEMLSVVFDNTNFYMQRTAEEAFIDTAVLDSSVIKHGKNLGYNPIRKTPAEAEIEITIKGPLPSSLLHKQDATIYFSQDVTDLSFNNHKFILNTDYSYLLTKKDIEDGQSSTWSKTLSFSVPVESMKYFELQGVKLYDNSTLIPIKIFQGEVKTETIFGTANITKLGKSYQFYDINDINFSNWYGKRDPNGWFKNTFYTKNSWTKIGIGKNQEEALSDNNLFEIEDVSIYLNDNLLKENNNQTQLKICSLTTNSDKTMRLKFGDGINVVPGLISEDDNIYIQYLICDGADANIVGSNGGELKANNNFYANCAGDVIDITDNIVFTLKTDINGGVDFEDQQSIKNNAPMYFASNNRLVTKQDFVSYFKGLTTPLKVKNAIAWSQDEIENGEKIYKYLQNIICYCVASNLYNTNNTVYSPINVLTDNTTNTVGTFSLYGTANDYLNHLTDYLKMIISFDSFINTQYTEIPSQQWIKNIKHIRDNAENKMLINSKLVSLPPIVQYYDVVGTVSVNSLSNLEEYKRTVENDIYKWLDNNCNFNQKIYKSDIIKFFNKHKETTNVDLNIKVSDIIKSKSIKFEYNYSDTEFSDIFKLDRNIPGAITAGSNSFNTIYFDKFDVAGNELTVDTIENKSLKIKINNNNDELKINITPYSVYETNDKIAVTMYGFYNHEFTDNNFNLTLELPSTTDFYSLSTFSENNASKYGLSTEQVRLIKNEMDEWIKGSSTINQSSARSITLPYIVETNNIITREETIKRKGTLLTSYEQQLTEKAFWMYFIPNIINTYYNDDTVDFKDEEINGNLWQNIDRLVFDLYTQFKATFADNILDDNNNIVNFTMDNEIPVVRLNITYKIGN